jgi:hypothetical protein
MLQNAVLTKQVFQQNYCKVYKHILLHWLTSSCNTVQFQPVKTQTV